MTDILDEIFKSENIRYTISDKHIVLYKADKSELPGVNQKLKAITGVVLDNNNEPIIGAKRVHSGNKYRNNYGYGRKVYLGSARQCNN